MAATSPSMADLDLPRKYAVVTKAIATALQAAAFRKTGPGYLMQSGDATFGIEVISRPWSDPERKRFALNCGVWWRQFDKYALLPPRAAGWPGDAPDRTAPLVRPPEAAGEDGLWQLDDSTDIASFVSHVQGALAELLGRLDRLGDLADFEADLASRTSRSDSVTIENVKLLRLLVESERAEEAKALCAAWQGALRPGNYKIAWLADQMDAVLSRHAASRS